MKPLEGSRIVGRVGDQIILWSEVYGPVDAMLAPYKDSAPPEEFEAKRRQMAQQRLAQTINIELMYADARRTIPAEVLVNIENNVAKDFDTRHIKRLMQQTKVHSRAELDAKMRAAGTSLEIQKRNYIRQNMAYQWKKRETDDTKQVTHAELLAYYEQHLDQYRYPAQARWQQLMVRFSRTPSRRRAYQQIVDMGNAVFRGAAFEDVARRQSHGSTASEGGVFDWTSTGSLTSEVLDGAIFSLPVGRMSHILEDEQGYYIIRVIERKDAGVTAFVEKQDEIKEKIVAARQSRIEAEFEQRIRRGTPVWTIFDDQPNRDQLSDRPGGREASGGLR